MTADRPGRRSFGPVVLLGLVAGGLAAVAGNKPWAVPDVPVTRPAAPAVGYTLTGSVPAVGALGLVVLACWGVVLVTRGRARRAVALLGLVAAVGALAAVVLGWTSAAEEVRTLMAQAGDEPAVASTPWAWAGVVGVVLSVLATGLAVRFAPAWPEMGRRYDAPVAGAEARAATDPVAPGSLEEVDDVGDRSRLDLWRAMDEGHDPTA